MKHINCTEHTTLNPAGEVIRTELRYTSCDGPIEDYIGYGDVVTPALIQTHNLIVTVNHRVTHQQLRATIRWFDESKGEGMVTTEQGDYVCLHFSAIEGVSKHNYAWPADADRELLSMLGGVPCLITLLSDYSMVDTCVLLTDLKGTI